MDKSLLQNIINEFRSYGKDTLLVENNDGFLFRKDIRSIFESQGINVVPGSSVKQRIAYELRSDKEILVLIAKDKIKQLEDIRLSSAILEFRLEQYLPAWHIPTILNQEIEVLEHLFNEKKLFSLNQKETKAEVEAIIHQLGSTVKPLDLSIIEKKIQIELNNDQVDWLKSAVFFQNQFR
jgi:hypothetical protein